MEVGGVKMGRVSWQEGSGDLSCSSRWRALGIAWNVQTVVKL